MERFYLFLSRPDNKDSAMGMFDDERYNTSDGKSPPSGMAMSSKDDQIGIAFFRNANDLMAGVTFGEDSLNC